MVRDLPLTRHWKKLFLFLPMTGILIWIAITEGTSDRRSVLDIDVVSPGGVCEWGAQLECTVPQSVRAPLLSTAAVHTHATPNVLVLVLHRQLALCSRARVQHGPARRTCASPILRNNACRSRRGQASLRAAHLCAACCICATLSKPIWPSAAARMPSTAS